MRSAGGDKLERVVQDLQQGLGALVTEQGALKHRLRRVIQGVQSMTQPVSGTETQLNMSLIKVSCFSDSLVITRLTIAYHLP